MGPLSRPIFRSGQWSQTTLEPSVSTKKKILIQLDCDEHASVFDGVVAVDAGVDHLFQYSRVRPAAVRGLIHGAMFTRGPADLQSTAVFVGGSDVSIGHEIAAAARSVLFDPFRVSIMFDSNGCNSTAAAAVLSAAKHVDLSSGKSLVLAATGAVGQAVCTLVTSLGGEVIVGSRNVSRAEETIKRLGHLNVPTSGLKPLGIEDESSLKMALGEAIAVFSCGAAGVELLNGDLLNAGVNLKAAIDLNAVPPAGLFGIGVMDQGELRGNRFDYGALGVGGLKMKIHKRAVQQLFTSNNHFIDAHEMMKIGRSILAA